jgi:hypothetical protein
MLIKSSSEKNLEFPNPSIEKSLKSSLYFRNHVSYVFVVHEIILGKLSLYNFIDLNKKLS